jgi:plastocyanin
MRRIAVVTLMCLAAPAAAQTDAAETARLKAEVARLGQEVRELRQLILQTVQNDQQHFEMLLKLILAGGGASGQTGAASPHAPISIPGAEPKEAAPPPPAVAVGNVSGRVHAEGDLGEAYVWIDGYRSSPVKNRTVEIRQKDKRFVPAVQVVQVGTRVLFPNFDNVIHNVFSATPDNHFDLGNVKAGEKTDPIVLLKPGHVEVYCNIHSKMRADLLVVPNPFWAKVAADGSFQIPGVPVGQRKVVLWGPALAPASQRVEVTPHGNATVTLNAAKPGAPRPHLNKHGQPYGSYDE